MSRGFGVLKEKNPERMKEISRQGGRAAHAQGTAHEFTQEEAKRAGSLGGKKSHENRKAKKKQLVSVSKEQHESDNAADPNISG